MATFHFDNNIWLGRGWLAVVVLIIIVIIFWIYQKSKLPEKQGAY